MQYRATRVAVRANATTSFLCALLKSINKKDIQRGQDHPLGAQYFPHGAWVKKRAEFWIRLSYLWRERECDVDIDHGRCERPLARGKRGFAHLQHASLLEATILYLQTKPGCTIENVS